MSPRSGRSVEGDESVSSRRENVSQDTVSSVQYCKGRATRLVALSQVAPHEARGPALVPRGDRNDHHRGVERPDRLDAQQLEPHLGLHRALERPHDGVRAAAQLTRRGDDSLRLTPELASVLSWADGREFRGEAEGVISPAGELRCCADAGEMTPSASPLNSRPSAQESTAFAR